MMVQDLQVVLHVHPLYRLLFLAEDLVELIMDCQSKVGLCSLRRTSLLSYGQ